MTVARSGTWVRSALVDDLRGGLVVSCQADPGTPLDHSSHMVAMARSAVGGGAVGIRAEGSQNVAAIRSAVTVPVIGLWKEEPREGVFITPTVALAEAVVAAGADIVAADATRRPRPDGRSLVETIAAVHRAGRLFLADVATVEEGLLAEEAGADLVATTLAGYVGDGAHGDGPDIRLVEALAGTVRVPVIAEGRISTPEQARQALDAGAWAVVVGKAITAPTSITARFVTALSRRP